MRKPSSDPPGPRARSCNYPLQRILELRNLLAEALLADFRGKTLTGAAFERLVDVTRERLPGRLERPVVRESCRHLAGVPLDDAALKGLAWRLAGNLPLLRSMRAVPPWTRQAVREWVPVQIASCRRLAKPRRGPGAEFAFTILAGTPAGLAVAKWWPLRLCRFWARRLGFTRVPRTVRRPPLRPYAHPEDFVTLRLYGLVTPELCREGKPDFRQIEVPPAVAAWNLEQLRHTFRTEAGYACPRGHPASFACRLCPAGYRSCRAGKHARDYVFGPCPECKRAEAPFDPDWSDECCVECHWAAQRPRR